MFPRKGVIDNFAAGFVCKDLARSSRFPEPFDIDLRREWQNILVVSDASPSYGFGVAVVTPPPGVGARGRAGRGQARCIRQA